MITLHKREELVLRGCRDLSIEGAPGSIACRFCESQFSDARPFYSHLIKAHPTELATVLLDTSQIPKQNALQRASQQRQIYEFFCSYLPGMPPLPAAQPRPPPAAPRPPPPPEPEPEPEPELKAAMPPGPADDEDEDSDSEERRRARRLASAPMPIPVARVPRPERKPAPEPAVPIDPGVVQGKAGIDKGFWKQLDALDGILRANGLVSTDNGQYLCNMCKKEVKSWVKLLEHCWENHRDRLARYD
jgi:hypothetical protein